MALYDFNDLVSLVLKFYKVCYYLDSFFIYVMDSLYNSSALLHTVHYSTYLKDRGKTRPRVELQTYLPATKWMHLPAALI